MLPPGWRGPGGGGVSAADALIPGVLVLPTHIVPDPRVAAAHMSQTRHHLRGRAVRRPCSRHAHSTARSGRTHTPDSTKQVADRTPPSADRAGEIDTSARSTRDEAAPGNKLSGVRCRRRCLGKRHTYTSVRERSTKSYWTECDCECSLHSSKHRCTMNHWFSAGERAASSIRSATGPKSFCINPRVLQVSARCCTFARRIIRVG